MSSIEQHFTGHVERIDPWRVRIPKQGAMRVEGVVYADDALYRGIAHDMCLQQVMNVATLPGIVRASIAMPDMHWGYGFPIGGVAAFDCDDGVVSPGGVGYDINCGVRLLRSELTIDDVRPHIAPLTVRLYQQVPSGVGSHGVFPRLSEADLRGVLRQGAAWVIERGFGAPDDLAHIEAGGCIAPADAERISERAKHRGRDQLGTLGSGNHFLEIEYVSQIFDESVASKIGLFPNQICVTIHCGSRGLGHQTCEDHLAVMLRAAAHHGIALPDPQLCCAPIRSDEGQAYLGAMAAAANFAFANRQAITHQVREVFAHVLGKGPADLQLHTVYDVCHNIAKIETHTVDGAPRKVCVHRKGATRAFPPGHPETPAAYQHTGQPVLIPGDMGRYSYVLVGTNRAFAETFGSCCHGAGRRLSRHAAAKAVRGTDPIRELARQGIIVQAASSRTVAEEVPQAYKDVADVVRVVEGAGLARIVAQLKPIGVVKG